MQWPAAVRDRFNRVLTFVRSTPRRTFILYPALVILTELVRRKGRLKVDPLGLLLMAWGYLQFRLVGNYRQEQGAGPRGFGRDNLPVRLLQDGPFAYTRNPMYVGHLIFLFGLGGAFHSRLGQALFAVVSLWFHWRVLQDEAMLREKFGAEYEEYTRRVKRWVPFLF